MSRIASAHERYRERLEALPRMLQEAGLDTWTRMHERFEPDREPYATYVLCSPGSPQRILRVDAFLQSDPRLTPVPPDPALPALASVLAGPGRSVVRYHPGLRCTVRVAENGATRFAKVYAKRRDPLSNTVLLSTFSGSLDLWAASSREEVAFLVARPERFDAALDTVWQEGVGGTPVKPRLEDAEGPLLARRIGLAAGSLPRAALRLRARRGRRSELARTALRCAELERRVPGLGAQAQALLDTLEARRPRGDSARRPVHGALHPSQWLENGSGLTLLDYDSLALGDPELDAATFLADLDVLNRRRVAVERLTEAFLAAYEEAAGPLDRDLLRWYRAQRLFEKALRVARALRPDGARKAGRRLTLALECLEAGR